jgi:hypothetical protein
MLPVTFIVFAMFAGIIKASAFLIAEVPLLIVSLFTFPVLITAGNSEVYFS